MFVPIARRYVLNNHAHSAIAPASMHSQPASAGCLAGIMLSTRSKLNRDFNTTHSLDMYAPTDMLLAHSLALFR